MGVRDLRAVERADRLSTEQATAAAMQRLCMQVGKKDRRWAHRRARWLCAEPVVHLSMAQGAWAASDACEWVALGSNGTDVRPTWDPTDQKIQAFRWGQTERPYKRPICQKSRFPSFEPFTTYRGYGLDAIKLK